MSSIFTLDTPFLPVLPAVHTLKDFQFMEEGKDQSEFSIFILPTYNCTLKRKTTVLLFQSLIQ